MKKTYIIFAIAAAVVSGCSKDDDFTPQQPESTGTFVDERDNKTYHYVTYCGLDWSVENLAYDLNDEGLCVKYKPSELEETDKYDYNLLAKIGYHYTYDGALKAVPEGWRVPTDEEWSKLEATYAYLSSDFKLYYGGYHSNNADPVTHRDRFVGAWAFFWTSSKDKSKGGEFYFYRKKFYSNNYMERYSMEPDANFLNVRMVRDHKQNN